MLTLCLVSFSQRGTYCQPQRKPNPGEKKLHLLIEGTSKKSVADACREIERIMEEVTIQVGMQMAGERYGKYTVL